MASSSHFSNEATEGAAARLAAETETPKPIARMAASCERHDTHHVLLGFGFI
jgi:DNA-binding FadR family transcriptional regulator